MAQTLAHAPSAVSVPAQSPVTVETAYSRFVAAVRSTIPHHIGCVADAGDIEERAAHIDVLMEAFAGYISRVVSDTAASSVARIAHDDVADRIAEITDMLDDLRSDIAGRMSEAAYETWEAA